MRLSHLRAALALWERFESSVRYIFGDRTGNSNADRILKALREHGSTPQAWITGELFDGNTPAEQVRLALGLLAKYKLAKSRIDDATGGRPATIWEAIE
jgi:hypothetical protein